MSLGTNKVRYSFFGRKRRYTKVINDLGMVGLGNPISGLHVHVEVPEPDQRVEIMQRLVPFLPLLLALSTSSPFWCGYPTGLLGYRNAANDALPRTGFPEMFRDLAEYETYVKRLLMRRLFPTQPMSGGRCGLPCSTLRSSSASRTAVRRLPTPWQSRPSFARWSGT
jgi:gamma-glutamyl:cysteine ligase YbdK (ATP-grasp superfamily)